MNVLNNILRFILTLLRDAIADLLSNIFFDSEPLLLPWLHRFAKVTYSPDSHVIRSSTPIAALGYTDPRGRILSAWMLP